MHTLPQKSPWYCSYKSLLLESDKVRLQKRLTLKFPGTCGWNHNFKSSLHLSLQWSTAFPVKKCKPEFSGVANSPSCQTTPPPPAPGAFYPAAMKTSPHKANPLPIPPSWFQLHNEPNQGRLSGQFLISSELPHPYSGSHSSGDSFTSGVSFVIYHPATSEILSHQWQQQPPWLSRVLTHRKLKPWDNGCFLPPEACYLKKEHIMLMPKGELRYSLFTDPCL